MNSPAPLPIIPEDEIRLAEARLAEFDRDGKGHTLDAMRTWAAERARDPAAPCPMPATLR